MMALEGHRKVLPIPKEWPKRFILTDWVNRPEYACVQRNDKKGTMGRFDLLSCLEKLGWSIKLCVHNLKLCFLSYRFPWVDKSWKFDPSSKSYCKFFDLSYPVRVQCYDTGSVMVSVKCSARPFPLDITGLQALNILLGEVRQILHAPCVPDPMTWRVAHWHLNRDSEPLMGGGPDSYITFRDFFGDSAQFYYKHSLDVIRAEVSQCPDQSIQEVFEKIIDRDNFGGGRKADV
jgi:hypothetical protein